MGDQSLRILVIDENRAHRNLIHTLAENSGWESLEAGDSRDGLAKARQFRPDIVVTEWSMPIMEGIDLVRAIRAEPDAYRPYIILSTRLEDEGKLLAAFDAGIDDFVGRPLSARIVAARLRAGQRIVRVQRENERHARALQCYSEALTESRQRLWEVAVTDELTGLPNRNYGMARMQQEWSAAEQCHAPLSCMVIDVDGLTQVCNQYA